MREQDRAKQLGTWRESDQPRAASLIAALSARADEIRAAELARAERRLRGLTRTEGEIVDAITTSVVRALLREPRARLNAAEEAERAGYAEAIRHVFALDPEPAIREREELRDGQPDPVRAAARYDARKENRDEMEIG